MINSRLSVPSWEFGNHYKTLSSFIPCKKSVSLLSLAQRRAISGSYLPTFSSCLMSDFTIHTRFMKEPTFMGRKHYTFTNTGNSKRYTLHLCHPWRKSPDSLWKYRNFVSCWARRHKMNFVKQFLQQILHYLGLLVNSANVISIWSLSTDVNARFEQDQRETDAPPSTCWAPVRVPAGS